jgi:hypothetical protein
VRDIGDALGMSYQRVHEIVDVSTGKGAVKRRVTLQSDTGEANRIEVGDCTFCGAAANDVQKLIAGPGVYICDRCVELAHEVDVKAQERTSDLTMLAPLPLGDGKARCSFRGRKRDQARGEAMVHAPLRPRVGKHTKRTRDAGVGICRDCSARRGSRRTSLTSLNDGATCSRTGRRARCWATRAQHP